jgi:peptidoglycan-N-acetylglucosamine deacetylase
MRRQATATFSWDDGHPLDLRIADLFKKYGARCTYYVPKHNSENLPTMNSLELKTLAEAGFDIHSHTLNHLYLENLSSARQASEINEGKKFVEDATGIEDHIFCYPGGKYTRTTVELVKQAGFKFARTIDMGFRCAYSSDNFLMPTTSIIGPLSILQIAKHSLKRRFLRRAFDIFAMNRAILDQDWKNIVRDESPETCYHFWGHSWEIEKYGLWEILENLLLSLKASDTSIITNKQFYERITNPPINE